MTARVAATADLGDERRACKQVLYCWGSGLVHGPTSPCQSHPRGRADLKSSKWIDTAVYLFLILFLRQPISGAGSQTFSSCRAALHVSCPASPAEGRGHQTRAVVLTWDTLTVEGNDTQALTVEEHVLGPMISVETCQRQCLVKGSFFASLAWQWWRDGGQPSFAKAQWARKSRQSSRWHCHAFSRVYTVSFDASKALEEASGNQSANQHKT